ncbi:MAG: ammonium transporter, partial [Actinomycetia bacterium]|nr:ammonium transporter [Actinomycetes bacterium]
FIASLVLFITINATVGLRVSREEEIHGLDIHEHGMWGYPEQFVGEMPQQIAAHYPPPGIAKQATKRIISKEEAV